MGTHRKTTVFRKVKRSLSICIMHILCNGFCLFIFGSLALIALTYCESSKTITSDSGISYELTGISGTYDEADKKCKGNLLTIDGDEEMKWMKRNESIPNTMYWLKTDKKQGGICKAFELHNTKVVKQRCHNSYQIICKTKKSCKK